MLAGGIGNIEEVSLSFLFRDGVFDEGSILSTGNAVDRESQCPFVEP